MTFDLKSEARAHGEHGERERRGRELRAEPGQRWRMRQTDS